MMVDHISGTHRCSCGRLYKDYTGLMGKCEKCKAAISDEWKRQKEADALSKIEVQEGK